ncbi:MAG: DNA-directed DNA polymerase II small subunit [Nanoarchaeota archaeon]|nr:DNA-directed DNA polymerase II small subunit [Nanoarchaeota archaeon]
MEKEQSNKEIVNHFLEKKVLLAPDTKGLLSDLIGGLSESGISLIDNKGFLFLNKDIYLALKDKENIDLNWSEFEKIKTNFEKRGEERPYKRLLGFVGENQTDEKLTGGVKVVTSYKELSSKKEACDFAMYFNARLEALQKILYSRTELGSVTSISRVLNKRDRESISLIGLVKDKRTTKNGNIMLTLEDSTGEIKILINKNKPEIYDIAKATVLDEAIGITGVNGTNIVFANNLLLPEVPSTHELKKSDNEAYALFLADLHVGSNNFLDKDFDKFLSWINQEAGNEKQREIASKVKYIFVVGDLIDGVGIYPGQEEELVIKDVYGQYKVCAELLSRIPQHISLIICPGNHDALRIAEPQPILHNEFCKEFDGMPNVTLVSNPAVVNIHSDESFSGYDVLLYHGYSFDYYVANVDSIRNSGGYDRADLIMKFLLKRRHLAPTHTSTLYIPYSDEDPLVINTVPDFFITGHIHKSAVSSYRNTTLISCSCWQSKTTFQEKVGHHPEPSRVPLVNLATREVKILKFGK